MKLRGLWQRFGRWARARQRGVDMDVLWPECIKHAPTMAFAKAAFACHVFNDPAWTKDFSHEALRAFIDGLTIESLFLPPRPPQPRSHPA